MKDCPINANVLLIRCTYQKRTFGARVQKMSDGDWWRTWSFPLSDAQAKNEGYDKTPIQGNLNATEDYPGCPHCGEYGFVQCGTCRKISCYKGEATVTCDWCGATSGVVTATSKFDVSGGDY